MKETQYNDRKDNESPFILVFFRFHDCFDVVSFFILIWYVLNIDFIIFLRGIYYGI
jgi:hypothetical protein